MAGRGTDRRRAPPPLHRLLARPARGHAAGRRRDAQKAGDRAVRYDAIIIGGGASGLAAGVSLARAGWRTAILEAQPRVGRKLLSTGNGRCNFTNINASAKDYLATPPLPRPPSPPSRRQRCWSSFLPSAYRRAWTRRAAPIRPATWPPPRWTLCAFPLPRPGERK